MTPDPWLAILIGFGGFLVVIITNAVTVGKFIGAVRADQKSDRLRIDAIQTLVERHDKDINSLKTQQRVAEGVLEWLVEHGFQKGTP